MSFTNIPTKAYVVHGKGQPFKLEDVVLDGVCPNEVLVEIKYSGLCHTVSKSYAGVECFETDSQLAE